MRILVLLAVYNGEKYLRAQLDSLFAQTFQSFELWIRDNCSTDSTLSIIDAYEKRYPGRITLVHASTHSGPMQNFATLAALVEGDYLFFCDADDIWLPEKMEKSLQRIWALEKEHGTECPCLVHSDLCVVDAQLDTLHSSFWHYRSLTPLGGRGRLISQLAQNSVTGNTICMNHALAKWSLPIPSEAIMHDWWLGIIASAFGIAATLEEATILYRQHGANSIGAKKRYLSYFSIRKRQAFRARLKNQASCFLERYREELSDTQKEEVKRWITYIHEPFFALSNVLTKCNFHQWGVQYLNVARCFF